MDKKESTTFSPSMCEKLFKAFNTAFQSLCCLTFHHQVPGGTTNPSSTGPNHSLNPGTKDPRPQNILPTSVQLIRPASEKKPAEAVAPKAEPHDPLPTPAATPPPSTSIPVRKVPDRPVPSTAPPKAMPMPAPPKAMQIPQPIRPTAVATPQPLPQPAPPAGAPAAPERPKKNIDEMVVDYINRVKAKMRTTSGVGRKSS